jgi:hypothetical protein
MVLEISPAIKVTVLHKHKRYPWFAWGELLLCRNLSPTEKPFLRHQKLFVVLIRVVFALSISSLGLRLLSKSN